MPDVRSFSTYWMAETLRLRESHWGPLEDAAEVRRARMQGGTFTERILLRSLYLGQREKLDVIIRQWMHGAKLVLIGMIIGALIAGIGAASGALGDSSQSVNLVVALTAMLGLHCLTFILWLLSFTLGHHGGGVWLGQLWLWLTQKLARGPDAALTPRALVDVLGRNSALRWVLSSISHSVWASAMLGVVLALLVNLSARRYNFNWETTLLSGDTFVTLTQTLGWLPAWLGFSMPAEDVIRASNGLSLLPESAQALWSGWLIGCVVVYGVAPRLLGLVISLILARRNIAKLQLDENLPAYASLRERLQPTSEKMGIDAPDAHEFPTHRPRAVFGDDGSHTPLLAGIELAPETQWPPEPLTPSIGDLGIIDTRGQRSALLDHLQQHPAQKLLLVCDGRQTPDRGALALIADLTGVARQVHIALSAQLSTAAELGGRTDIWQQRLAHAGFMPEQIHLNLASALKWLKTGEAEHDQR